jgi:ribosomal protein L15
VENSKEIGMVDNAEKAEVSVVKEGLETKVADKDVKVDLETKVADNVVKEASKKKVVANDAKAVVNVVKEGQVHRIEVRLMENHSRENHNQFKESIS